MDRFLAAMLIILSLCSSSSAGPKPCTKTDAIQAEDSASQLHSWQDIYASFRQFGHCDDGAVAEGYSDAIVRMLAEGWNEFPELAKLSSDKEFYAFVLRHIDATTDEGRLQKIMFQSGRACPASMTKMCSEIRTAARSALNNHKQ